MILFLDFDGTLHPLWTPIPGKRKNVMHAYQGPWLTEADTLAKILAPYGEKVRIVIASLWAKRLELNELRALLPHTLQEQVIDAIWTLRDDPSALGKFRAIQAWLERAKLAQEWLALDDDPRVGPLRFRAD